MNQSPVTFLHLPLPHWSELLGTTQDGACEAPGSDPGNKVMFPRSSVGTGPLNDCSVLWVQSNIASAEEQTAQTLWNMPWTKLSTCQESPRISLETFFYPVSKSRSWECGLWRLTAWVQIRGLFLLWHWQVTSFFIYSTSKHCVPTTSQPLLYALGIY